jgi:hypothetical protein
MGTKRLTIAAVERLKCKPGQKRREEPDGGSGLYLVVQKSGVKSWAVRYRLGGKPDKYTLPGRPPTTDLVEARRQAKVVLDIVDAGKNPNIELAARDTQAVTDTIENVAKEYILRHCRKNKTWRDGARNLGFRPDPEDEKVLHATGIPARTCMSNADCVIRIPSSQNRFAGSGGSGVGA